MWGKLLLYCARELSGGMKDVGWKMILDIQGVKLNWENWVKIDGNGWNLWKLSEIRQNGWKGMKLGTIVGNLVKNGCE